MSRSPIRRRLVALASLLAVAALAPAGSAVAQAPENPWTPHASCPVDDPEMAGAPASTYGTGCVSSFSPSGSFKIGATTMATGATRLQLGLSGRDPDNPSFGKVIPAAGGQTLVSDPVKVPGGVLGLMCPSGTDLIVALCRQVEGLGLNRVTATVELAGQPTSFNAIGALITGVPLVDLPVKIHLNNVLLGPSCYIGSDANPIVLRPETLVRGTPRSVPEPNGFPVIMLQITGSTMGDDSFAVPAATGCGPLSLADSTINQRQGLPSPAGANELILGDTTAHTAITQQGGQVLSDAWHASLDP